MTGRLDNSNPSSDNVPGDAADPLPEIIPEQNAGPDDVTLTALVDTSPAHSEPVILNKDGTVRKKPGRKPGQKTAAPVAAAGDDVPAATLSPAAPKTPQEKKAVRLGCDQTARAVLGTVVGAMRELVGPEWDFQSQDEADGMRVALAAFIESKGGGEMSPELALLLVTCGYAGPRFAHENTRSKFGAFFGKVWGAIRAIISR